jgi:hypothetical protein
MSFEEIRIRIFKRWWIVLATTLVFIFAFYPWASSVSYQSSVALGVSFNNKSYSSSNTNMGAAVTSTDITKSIAYVNALESFSLYLEGRFRSVEAQSTIATTAGIKQKTFNEKTPFYVITPVGAGFVSVSYNGAATTKEADQFLSGVKLAYSNIVDEWNNSRLDEYKITKMDKFNEAIVESERPLQFQILPIIIGWLFGLVLAVVIPGKKLENK